MLDAFGRKSSFFHNTVGVQDAIFEGREERLAEVRHDVEFRPPSRRTFYPSRRMRVALFVFDPAFPRCLTPPQL